MDPRLNPYTPNAGAMPPALAGRDAFILDFQVLIDRLTDGYSDQSMIITGLRGVGKTVLLSEFGGVAAEKQWLPLIAEIAPGFAFTERMAQLVRSALFTMSPRLKWNDRLKRAAAVLKSFSLTFSPEGTITARLDAEPLEGVADSGFLDIDLTDLLTALGEAAREQGTGVVFLLDEVQFLKEEELASLVVALHRMVQKSLPVTLVGAGLPQLPSLVGEAKSYAERLFNFVEIGQLTEEDASAALVDPVIKLGVKYSVGALESVYKFTEGYPYFLQEYGKMLWSLSDTGQILRTDVHAAEKQVVQVLDRGFFRVRTDKLPHDHVTVLRAMAELGAGTVRSDDVAASVDLEDGADCNAILEDLTTHAMTYSPRFGYYSFTVPQFGNYLRRRFRFSNGKLTWT